MMSGTSISLGKPVMAPCLVPVLHDSTPACINGPFMVDGACYKVTAMSFGSPHGAVFVEDVDNTDVSLLGVELGTHALFPKGANIVFIQVLDSENLKARLWQRDKGEIPFTLEAVCVAGVAARMLQKTLAYQINVSMGDTVFCVHWESLNGDINVSGPVELIAQLLA